MKPENIIIRFEGTKKLYELVKEQIIYELELYYENEHHCDYEENNESRSRINDTFIVRK